MNKVADLVRWGADCLVDDILFHRGGVYRLHEVPAAVLDEVWAKHHARDCYRRKVDPRDEKPLTRARLEELAYATKHADFKGDGPSGKSLLICRKGEGTCSVPLSSATDEELYAILLP